MRVLISGGGIAGLTISTCFRRAGIDTVVVEKAPRPRGEGYMIDFFGPGYAAAEALGLLGDLAAIHYEISELKFLDGNGADGVSLRYRDVRRRLFRNRHFNFMRGDLERVLVDHAGVVRYATEIVALREDGEATLSDGSTESWDLIVGADGLHSNVRRLVFGDAGEFFFGYATAAFIIDDPPARLGDAFRTVTEPGRQVSVYPIRGGRVATFFLHKRAMPLASTSRAMAIEELRREYAGMHWIVPELLARLDGVGDIYFDNVSQVQIGSWTRGRTVLLGDAAWCVSLLAGQGASLAMAGAYVLAEELSRSSPERALRQYERRLRPRVEKAQKAAGSIARWFLPETKRRIRLRNAGLRLFTLPLVASFYRRGLAGDESGIVSDIH